jgi:phosphotransferase system IIB component
VTLAEQLLSAVGGTGNVTSLTRCWARLRFVLNDLGMVDEPAIDALDDVAIAVHQHGQYQIALRRGLLETFDELVELLRGLP